MASTMKKYLFIILIWLWLTMALLTLFISRIPPFHFLDSDALIRLIEESKLLFIAIIFPLIINKLSADKESASSFYLYLLDCMKPFIIFILLSLPLTIMASYLGNADLEILLRTNLLLLLMAIFLTMLFLNLPEKYGAIYYLVLFIIYGVGPVLYYLVLEFTETSWRFLFLLNPSWLCWQINNAGVFNPAWLVQCLIWAGLIIVVVTIYRIARLKRL